MKWEDFEPGVSDETFEIKHWSRFYKREFAGKFTVKKQTIGDAFLIEQFKAELMDGASFDMITGQFAHNISILKICLTRSPDWFLIDDIKNCKDAELVYRVVQEVATYENSFSSPPEQPETLEKDEKEPEKLQDVDGSVPSGGSEQRQEQPGVVTPEELVDEEVLSIAKIR